MALQDGLPCHQHHGLLPVTFPGRGWVAASSTERSGVLGLTGTVGGASLVVPVGSSCQVVVGWLPVHCICVCL